MEFSRIMEEFSLVKEEFVKNDPEIIDLSCSCADNISEIDCKDEPSDVNIGGNNDTEVENGLFCWECKQKYVYFCLNCPMLVQILNNDVRTDSYNRTKRTLPKDILTVGQSSGSTSHKFGILTMQTIPEGVKFGPCEGSSVIQRNSGCAFEMKRGKFVKVNKDACTNWMLYINCVTKESDGNLIMFQQDFNLYFQSTRQIQKGEELLLYCNPHALISNTLNERVYYYPTENKNMRLIFACTYCCLGFNSEIFLREHKTVCPYITPEDILPIKEIVQCSFCLIYLDEKEYFGFHMTCCSEKYLRRDELLHKLNIIQPPSVRMIEKSGHIPFFKKYSCSRCSYTTKFYEAFKNHICSKFQKKDKMENGLLLLENGQCNKKSRILERIDVVGINNVKINKTTHSLSKNKSACLRIEGYKNGVTQKSRILERIDVIGVDSDSTESCGSINGAVRKSKRIGDGIVRESKCINAMCCMIASDDMSVPKNIVGRSSAENCNYSFANYLRKNCECIEEKNKKSKTSKHEDVGTAKKRCVSSTNENLSTGRIEGFSLVKVFDFDRIDIGEDWNYDSLESNTYKVHNLAKNYECDHCTKKYFNKDELTEHLRLCGTKNDDRLEYQCEKCSFKTYHSQSFHWHKSRAHMSQEEVSSHLNKISNKTSTNVKRSVAGLFICSNCNRGFLHHRQLVEHAPDCDRTKKEITSITSNVTKKTTKETKKMIRSLSVDEANGKMTLYQCKLCKEIYRQYHTVKVHLRNKHAAVTQENAQLRCCKCSFETPYKGNLKRHLFVHEKVKPFECQICNTKFNRRSHFDDHVRAYHIKNSVNFKCKDCGQIYSYKQSLKRHQRDVHNKTQKYKFKK